jgi:hypothetical protein
MGSGSTLLNFANFTAATKFWIVVGPKETLILGVVLLTYNFAELPGPPLLHSGIKISFTVL